MEKKKEVIIPMPVAAPAAMNAQSFDQRDNAIRQEQLQRLYDKYPSEPTAPAAPATPPSMWNRALNYISTFGATQAQLLPAAAAPPLVERFLTPDEEVQVYNRPGQEAILNNKKFMRPPLPLPVR